MSSPMLVTEPLERAFGHARRMLFQPFLFNRWISLGVIIFLESLVQGSGGLNFRWPISSSSQSGPSKIRISETINHAVAWIVDNPVVIALAIILLAMLIGVMVLVTWLGSRGQIMFVRAVALEDTSIGENWHATRETASSLFRFRLMLVGATLTVSAVSLIFATITAVGLAAQGTDSLWPYFIALLPVLLLWIPFSLLVWTLSVVLRNFVSPLMWLRSQPCAAAWKEFAAIAAGNKLAVLLLLLLRLVYCVIFGIASLLIGCMTCCLGFLPVLHQALFAPFYVFDRAYTLCALESLGPDYAFFLRAGENRSGVEPPPLP
jgi:hypothetical protein